MKWLLLFLCLSLVGCTALGEWLNQPANPDNPEGPTKSDVIQKTVKTVTDTASDAGVPAADLIGYGVLAVISYLTGRHQGRKKGREESESTTPTAIV